VKKSGVALRAESGEIRLNPRFAPDTSLIDALIFTDAT